MSRADKEQVLTYIFKELSDIATSGKNSVHLHIQDSGGKLAYLNKILLINNLPVLPRLRKSFSFIKTILGIILLIVLISSLRLFLWARSYFPLVEFHDWSNVVSVFGSKIVVEPSLDTYFNSRQNAYDLVGIKNESLPHEVSTIVAEQDFSSLEIKGEFLDLIIIENFKPEVEIKCKSESEESNVQLSSIKAVELKLKGLSQCKLYLPKDKWLNIESEVLLVNIRSLEQSFLLKGNRGLVSLNTGRMSNFSNISFSLQKNNGKAIQNIQGRGSYKGEVILAEGEVFLYERSAK